MFHVIFIKQKNCQNFYFRLGCINQYNIIFFSCKINWPSCGEKPICNEWLSFINLVESPLFFFVLFLTTSSTVLFWVTVCNDSIYTHRCKGKTKIGRKLFTSNLQILHLKIAVIVIPKLARAFLNGLVSQSRQRAA